MNLQELTTEELQQHRTQAINEISKYSNIQMAKKIQLNSAYGAVG
jgi:hypothetical protein